MNVDGLQKYYNDSEAARAVLDHFASRERNWSETTVERLMQNVAADGHPLSRGAVVEVFKRLEELACGRFVPGRWDYKSRFEWSVGMVDAGRAAAGEPVEQASAPPVAIQPFEEEDEPADSDCMLEHSYSIRTDMRVTISLPKDLTPREASRLADFLRTLPFEE